MENLEKTARSAIGIKKGQIASLANFFKGVSKENKTMRHTMILNNGCMS